MRRRSLILSALPAVLCAGLFSGTASAIRTADDAPFVVAGGAPTAVSLKGSRPRSARSAVAVAALDRFRAARGTWSVLWDEATAVPLRIWGEGIATPGAIADAAIAEREAHDVLADELDLLAPGAAIGDFVVVKNVVHPDGARSVVFGQRFGGLEVIGARVRFTFKHDRLALIGSTASPHIVATVPSARVSRGRAGDAAARWIEQAFGTQPIVIDAGDAVVLPIHRADTGLEHRVVVPVEVESADPIGEWTVYVDAATGDPVARHSHLHHGEGSVRYRVPARHPGAGYQELPAIFATHNVDGVTTTSSSSGVFTWAGTNDATVAPGLIGPRARIENLAGSLTTTSLSVPTGGSAVWDRSETASLDAQLSAFIHANIAKQYALTTLNPNLSWLTRQMAVRVNDSNGTCNAFSNGDSIRFFTGGGGCQNTARIADVVYHEFGHSLHFQTAGHFNDQAFNEGVADYFSVTLTGDPQMALGFFTGNPNRPLRHADPPDKEHRYPLDLDPDWGHDSSPIISGALWDLRVALIAELGQSAGVALADDIFYGIIGRADDIPSSYAEALITDDNDGNLANGTPHKCAIDRAFGRHGLGAFGALPEPPSLDGLTVTVPQMPVSGTTACPGPQIASAQVTWRVRGDAATTGQVDLTAGAAGFTGALPAPQAGTVLQYRVRITFSDGSAVTYPTNPGVVVDANVTRWYETYVGPVTPIYCTDFETDPVADGWTLDGFEWGRLQRLVTTDDPEAAYDGVNVLATNLRGAYLALRTATATMPELDVSQYDRVRLQYRRYLNVEDGNYDRASIRVDGVPLWSNAAGNQGISHHHDAEWEFHDVDLTPVAADGRVQVAFQLIANGASPSGASPPSYERQIQYGGWTVDSLCIVAEGYFPACGNGIVDEADGETCDDGNLDDGDGCSAACADETTTEEEPPGCCSTGRGSAGGSVVLALALGAVVLRRRRRAR
jgi:cysteine-rich repeat protein